jgi:O-antigen/teichoic acid export membrane protein
MKSLKKNIIYNITYQVLILIIPLITSPYLARIVGASGVGIYSYTYSVVYYFMLLTLLGINNYGNRIIAKVREDKQLLSKNFYSIYYFQLIMGLLMLIFYFIYAIFFEHEHKFIALLQSLFVVSSILDINWVYFGLEEFKITVTRNLCVKLSSVILILLLVKSQNDLWKYTLIMAGTTVISQLILWPFVRKKVDFVKISFKDIREHIKPNLILFIPVISVSLYKMMDKIMLGIISNMNEVGYYENAEKIVSVPVTIISALGTVMLPRISNMVAKKDEEQIKVYILKSIDIVMFMTFSMMFGLISSAIKFSPLFFGNEFTKTGYLIILLSFTLPFLSFANILRTQYLIPKEKDKIYIKSVIGGAIINSIINFIFIPKFNSVGACFGTICAEFYVMIYQTISVRNELPLGKYLKISLRYLVKGILMFLIIYPLNYIKMNDLIRILFQVLVGGIVYCILNMKFILNFILSHWQARD